MTWVDYEKEKPPKDGLYLFAIESDRSTCSQYECLAIDYYSVERQSIMDIDLQGEEDFLGIFKVIAWHELPEFPKELVKHKGDYDESNQIPNPSGSCCSEPACGTTMQEGQDQPKPSH